MKKTIAYLIAIVYLSILTSRTAQAVVHCPNDPDHVDYCLGYSDYLNCLNALPCWEIEKVYGQQFGQTPYVKNNGRLDYFVIGEGYDQNPESKDHEILSCTDPLNFDTDGDAIPDGAEDSDGDELPDSLDPARCP